MRLSKLALAAAAVLSLDLAFAGPGLAQPAPSDQLGRQVAHELFTAVNMPALVRQGALSNSSGLEAFAKVRPEWKPLIVEALDETVTEDQPALEGVLGRALAKTMTADELAAGLTVFRDPQARAAIAAATRHENVGAPSCSQDCLRAMGTPAGMGFMQKMRTAFGPEAQAEMMAVVVPDMFIRFGQKAKAAEAKRAQP
jgi:hypothetical protein